MTTQNSHNDTTETAPISTECPCGGVRGVCQFHPVLAPPTNAGGPRAIDVARAWVNDHPHFVEVEYVYRPVAPLTAPPAPSVPAGARLLGPDDPEVGSDMIYATPDGGVIGIPQGSQVDMAHAQDLVTDLVTHLRVTGQSERANLLERSRWTYEQSCEWLRMLYLDGEDS